MPDKPQDRDLDGVLTQLEQGWQELVQLLRVRDRLRPNLITAEKILLVDGRGETRGWLGLQEDGAYGLALLDQAGRLQAWFGLGEDGTACLTLKDAAGRPVFETGGEPRAAGKSSDLAPDRHHPLSEADSREVLARLEQVERDLAQFRNLWAGAPPGDASPPPQVPERAAPAPEDEVGRRLARVERQGRLLPWAAGVMLVLWLIITAGLGVVLHRTFWQDAVVTAQAITLKDLTGLTRVWLGVRDGEVGLELFDPTGKRRTALGVGTGGAPALVLFDGEERLRAQLGLAPDGDPGLNLVDRAGLLRVALGRIDRRYQSPQSPLERPLSSLVLFNQEGIPVWHAPLRWRR